MSDPVNTTDNLTESAPNRPLSFASLAEYVFPLFQSWTWQMAWRDSRRSRKRLLFFSSCIVLGIAALAAIGSFAEQMERAVREQSKALLGADLVIASRRPFSDNEKQLIQSLGGEQARETSFSSMIYFPKTQGTRLVQARALQGNFPFYGNFDTDPPTAPADFRAGRGALVEANLMAQFGAQVGDPIKIGEWTGPIVGSLRRAPGETVGFSTIAPRVYFPLEHVDQTGLVQQGSLVRYRVYFKFPPHTNVEALLDSVRPQLEQTRLGVDTVAERQEDLGRTIENVYHFLNLVGFVALLLGGIGIATAIHAHVKQKTGIVAVLRCLGCSAGQAFSVYLAQGIGLGLIGGILGTLLGMGVTLVLPGLLADLIPVQVTVNIAWWALVRGMLLGLFVCVLFSFLPLLPLRRISPLRAIRLAYEPRYQSLRDPLQWIFFCLILATIISFAISQSRRWEYGLGFAFGLTAAFGLLAATGAGLIYGAKRIVSEHWPFTWRQGLANLYRPNNRTILVLLSLGLGTFLILTLTLVQHNLNRELVPSTGRQRGNAVLFDIQSDQHEAVINLLKAEGLPILQHAPIITMRLAAIRGRSIEEIKADIPKTIPNWVLHREYRSTYRDHLTETEVLISGQWHERAPADQQPVPVSVEQGIAERLQIGLGDELVFDIQGIHMTTRVANLRRVEWRRLNPNFFVVFPRGPLEEAPSFHVLVTQIDSADASARIQRAVVQQFPNVSVIDLTLVLQTVDNILDKMSVVVRFVAMFTVVTGLIVLAAAIMTGRYQRTQESTLLRTLGASRWQIVKMLALEYWFLGFFASLAGILLSLIASWALARFVFQIAPAISWWPILGAALAVSSLTMIIGLLSSRGISNSPPLEILRTESI